MSNDLHQTQRPGRPAYRRPAGPRRSAIRPDGSTGGAAGEPDAVLSHWRRLARHLPPALLFVVLVVFRLQNTALWRSAFRGRTAT